MIEPIVKRCAGLDVHKMKVTVTVLVEREEGGVQEETREYKTFRKHRKQLCRWLKRLEIDLAIMESTGNYWRSIHDSLEAASIRSWVVNARHLKQVPGRKTDVGDSKWLAMVGRMGLIRASFVPSKDLRELRLITRQRQKLMASLSAEKNRLHKVLDDAGIKLGAVVSDIDGLSAQAMLAGLLAGEGPSDLIEPAKGRLRGNREEPLLTLDGELSVRHLFVLQGLQEHILYLEGQLAELDSYLIAARQPYRRAWELPQTIPGIAAAVSNWSPGGARS